MRAVERDVLLLLLAMAAGAADGWSYTGLGHAFVANMTGNTVLLALGVVGHHDMLHPAIALGCYAPGVMLATFLTRKLEQGVVWGRAVSWTLLLEALLMGAAECGWVVLRRDGASGSAIEVLLAMVAFGIGMQSGAMMRLKIPGIVTTYITGTWTTLMSGFVKLGTEEKRKREKVEFEERLLLQGGVLAMYFVSAMASGFLGERAPVGMGMLPCGCVLVAAGYGFARG